MHQLNSYWPLQIQGQDNGKEKGNNMEKGPEGEEKRTENGDNIEKGPEEEEKRKEKKMENGRQKMK
jgi:hypothetical protein